MNVESTGKPRRSWLRRIGIALAVVVTAMLFWPPQWWPPSMFAAPTKAWQFYLEIGPVIAIYIDPDGNRITPTVFETEPGLAENLQAELASRNARPADLYSPVGSDGQLLMTRDMAAHFAGWLPGIHWETPPEDMDPFANGPVIRPARNEFLFFDRHGTVAFTVPLEGGGSSPIAYLGYYREGLAPLPTSTRESDDSYRVHVVGESGGSQSWVRAQHPTNFGFVTTEGEWAIPPQFDDARPFHQGLAAVSKDGLWGYIDPSGAFVIEPRWQKAQSFSEGLAAVHEEGAGWGYINPGGQWAIEPRFGRAGPFSEGLAAVAEGSPDSEGWAGQRTYGYIDPQGEWVIEPRFRNAEVFSSGRAAVTEGSDTSYFLHFSGYIDRAGELVIPGPYTFAMPFMQGEAHVIKRVTPARWLLAIFRHRVLNRPNWAL